MAVAAGGERPFCLDGFAWHHKKGRLCAQDVLKISSFRAVSGRAVGGGI